MTSEEIRGLVSWMLPRWPVMAGMEAPVLEAMAADIQPYSSGDVWAAVQYLHSTGHTFYPKDNPAGAIRARLRAVDAKPERRQLPGCAHRVGFSHGRGEVACVSCGKVVRVDCGCEACQWPTVAYLTR